MKQLAELKVKEEKLKLERAALSAEQARLGKISKDSSKEFKQQYPLAILGKQLVSDLENPSARSKYKSVDDEQLIVTQLV